MLCFQNYLPINLTGITGVSINIIFLAGKRVLEVGCGAGLPGVFAFAAGATVHFNDYNKVICFWYRTRKLGVCP